MDMYGQDPSAWSVFPELVWEQILDSTDDGKDIQNLLTVFPELGMRFHKKKTLWLFDKVFPHLFTKFNKEERFEFARLCRLPCKRWSRGIKNFIATHPSRRPYNQDGVNRRTVYYREFSYESLDVWLTGHSIQLDTDEEIRNFHEFLTKHSDPGNSLKTYKIEIFVNGYNQTKDLPDAVLTFLESFGKYIWDIHLYFDVVLPQDGKSAKTTFLKIVKCLSYLPNIRHLSFKFDPDATNFTNMGKLKFWTYLPKLSHLESWQLLWKCPPLFHGRLIKPFKTQVRKLEIGSEHLSNCLELENLVELDVKFFHEAFNIYKIQSVIKSFPLLKKLGLIIDLGFGTPRIEMTSTELFGILTNGQLEELDFFACQIARDCNIVYENMNEYKFSSVKYLKLTDYKYQPLDFLVAFPSLEHLDIYWEKDSDTNRKEPDVFKLPPEEVDVLTSTVRVYIYKPIVPAAVSIWDRIPSLKLLTTSNQKDTVVKKFAKECGNKPFYAYLGTRVSDADETIDDSDVDNQDNSDVDIDDDRDVDIHDDSDVDSEADVYDEHDADINDDSNGDNHDDSDADVHDDSDADIHDENDVEIHDDIDVDNEKDTMSDANSDGMEVTDTDSDYDEAEIVNNEL